MGKIFSVRDSSKDIQDSKGYSNTPEENDTSTQRSLLKEKQTLTIDFSFKSMFFVLLLLGFIFFAKQLMSVILFVFLGFVIMSTVSPVVKWLVNKGLPKGFSIGITYFFLVIIILAFPVLVSVPFINQLSGLVESLPNWINDSLHFLKNFSLAGYSLDIESINKEIMDILKGFPTVTNVKSVATFISDFFGIGAFLITSIVFSIYLVSEHDSFLDILLIRIISNEKRDRVKKLVLDVEDKLGNWVLGQGTVSLIAATFSFVILTVLKVPFALPLAMFAGLINLIPNLGSTLAAITMTTVALISVSPLNAAIVLVAFVLYQLVENTVITPKVMGNAVGLKPVVVLLGVIVFITFLGILGGFVAIPLMVILKILYEFYIDLQKLEAKGIV